MGIIKNLGKEIIDGAKRKKYFDVDIQMLKVCSKCGKIYGPWKKINEGNKLSKVRHQKCICQNRGSGKKWPGFDYNEVVTLCYCCGQGLLESGSKYSVWFCKECKERVIRFNTRFQKRIIPIGRHSVMAGYYVNPASSKNSEIEDFVAKWNGLVSGMDILDQWICLKIQENMHQAGYSADVYLTGYLKSVSKNNKLNSFQGLIEYFKGPGFSKVLSPTEKENGCHHGSILSQRKIDNGRKFSSDKVLDFLKRSNEKIKLSRESLSKEVVSMTKVDNYNDRMFENSVRYLGDGEPRKYALTLREELKKTPYNITTYAVGGSHPNCSSHVWAVYLKEKGRPKRTSDCDFTTGIFYTPAKTTKSKAWKGLAKIENWLKDQKIL